MASKIAKKDKNFLFSPNLARFWRASKVETKLDESLQQTCKFAKNSLADEKIKNQKFLRIIFRKQLC